MKKEADDTELSKESFDTLSQLSVNFLNEVSTQRDIQAADDIILLCSAFYIAPNEKENLQTVL